MWPTSSSDPTLADKTLLWPARACFGEEPWTPHTPTTDDCTNIRVVEGLVVLDPLVPKLPFLRLAAKQGTYKHALGLCVLPLPRLLGVLARDSTSPALATLSSLVCWLAWVLEQSAFAAQASGDLLQLPLQQGPVRKRAIPPAFKAAVSREAALGKLGKSPAQVVRSIRRFQRGRHRQEPEPGSHLWHDLAARQHLQATQTAFSPAGWRFLAVCCDATRFDGLDCLWAMVSSTDLGLASWCVPLVRPF